MKKIGIFYGSSTGTTQGIAETIASKLGVPASDVIDVCRHGKRIRSSSFRNFHLG